MKDFSPLLLGVVLILLASAQSGHSADPVADKLEKAKMKFLEDGKKIDALVMKYFEDKEKQARAAGNKKLVDQIKDERKAYEERGALAGNAPASLKKMIAAQRAALESAYAQAIKDYIRMKQDDEATAVEKEWKAFQQPQSPNKGMASTEPNGGIATIEPNKGTASIEPPGKQWIPLFNGKDLDGWGYSRKAAEQAWKVVDKVIQGEGMKGGEYFYLYAPGRDYDNFSLRMEVWYGPKTFSGIDFRSSERGFCRTTFSSRSEHTGTTWIGNKNGGQRATTTKSPPAEKWFTVEITAMDRAVTVRVAGEDVANPIDEKKIAMSGSIILFVANEGSVVRIRKIEILPLLKK